MKLVILVDELKYPPGIYGYNPLDISEIKKPIEGKLESALSILSSTLGISSGALTLGTAIRIGLRDAHQIIRFYSSKNLPESHSRLSYE